MVTHSDAALLSHWDRFAGVLRQEYVGRHQHGSVLAVFCGTHSTLYDQQAY